MFWCVAGLPFDIAADARSLVFRNRFASKRRIEGGAQIFSRHRNSVSRAAGVELSAVNEFQIFIEEKKIRRASGSIRLGDRLGFVKKIRERVTSALHFIPHFFRAVVRIIGGIVGVDGDDADTFALVVATDFRQFAAHVFHVRTVVANEHHEHGWSTVEVAERDRFTSRIWQLKIGRSGAERQHGGRGQSHVRNFDCGISIVERGVGKKKAELTTLAGFYFGDGHQILWEFCKFC